MERRLAIVAMLLAITIVPVWFFVDAANDEYRDSDLAGIFIADTFIALLMLACFWPAISRAARSLRLVTTTVIVLVAVGLSHVAAWWLASRHDLGAGMFVAYLVGSALATLAITMMTHTDDEALAADDT